MTGTGEEQGQDTGRPTARLTAVQLFQISVYWFALNSIWGGFEVFQQKRTQQLGGDSGELILIAMELIAMPVAALTMPVAGSISDYVTTRWGKRKPFILGGSAATFLVIVGLATAQHVVTLIAFFVLLQLTTNVARGPFAGLVPDLVPEQQVGIASGLMGLMITLGLVGGYLIISLGYLPVFDEDFTVPMILLGCIVLATAIGTTLWVPDGPPGKDRSGRSWVRVGLETFGRDILHERDYVFLLASRFCILMAVGFFMNLNIYYMERTFDLIGQEQGAWILVTLVISVAATIVGTLPGARLSDRVGRKPVIFMSAAIGAIGMTIVALAPSMPVAVGGVALVGLGGGAFLAVDWALMTEIIPKASAGRYMGMSNIVEATNGPFATAIGGLIMFTIGAAVSQAVGARAAMLAGPVLFAVGSALLTQVREPAHQRRAAPTTS
jgi:MFS family permease